MSAAGIDVFEKEPYFSGPLMELPNVIMTPHSAFYSDQGHHEMVSKAGSYLVFFKKNYFSFYTFFKKIHNYQTLTAQEARRVLSGEDPLYCVNKIHLKNSRFQSNSKKQSN